MIKIIKHGQYRKMTCPYCMCEFMYEKEDTGYAKTGPTEYERFIECPDCEEKITVKGKEND